MIHQINKEPDIVFGQCPSCSVPIQINLTDEGELISEIIGKLYDFNHPNPFCFVDHYIKGEIFSDKGRGNIELELLDDFLNGAAKEIVNGAARLFWIVKYAVKIVVKEAMPKGRWSSSWANNFLKSAERHSQIHKDIEYHIAGLIFHHHIKDAA